MNEFLSVLIGIVVIANIFFTIWSYYSLRRILKRIQKNEINNETMLEHIVHTRSSLNLIYASMATITFVLAFLGFNLKDKISQEVTKEISASAKVDLELLKIKSGEILLLDSLAIGKSKELNSINDRARSILNEINKVPTKAYVIQGVQLSTTKHFYRYSELETIDGEKLPTFFQRPAVFNSLLHINDGSCGTIIATATNEGIEFGDIALPSKIDLCIYPRK
jgi:hypothetical protein